MSKEFIFKPININDDFAELRKIFLLNLKKKISKSFYVWRYLINKKMYCYVIKKKKLVIGHVGFVKYKSQNGNCFLSRHSSFVDKIYRRKNLYSDLIKFCLQKFKSEKIYFILIWPNKLNRFTNKKFNNLIKLPILKMYMSKNKDSKNTKLQKLKNINQIESFINLKNNYDLIKKDKSYFNWRYFTKKPTGNFYYHLCKNKKSIIIFNYNKKENIYNLLDYIGDRSFFFNHIQLIINKLKFVFWVNEKNEKKKSFRDLKLSKYKNKEFYSYIIPVKNNFNISNYKFLDIQMGDTDVFIQSF